MQTDSRPESLAHVRRQVRETILRAGVGAAEAGPMMVAVGEVLSNTCLHAYQGGLGPVFVEVAELADTVSVVIRDDGIATVPPAVPLELPALSNPNGRGLYLAGCLADTIEVHLNPTGHGVTVRLGARRTAADESGPVRE